MLPTFEKDSREATIKFLVVDDEPAVARALGSALLDQGHEVVLAGSGEEALELIGPTQPDALFLDIVMTGMGGLETLRRIRSRFGGLSVIVLSESAAEDEITAAVRQLSVIDIIPKPEALRNLPAALQRIRRR